MTDTNNINNFEDMMARLSTIADTMENEEVTLAESLKLFEEGMNLGRECRGILGNVEVRVNEIKEQAKRVGIPSTNPEPSTRQTPEPHPSEPQPKPNTHLGNTPLPF